ncbi:hypothetical protein F-E9_191 [Faustovirus]|nr:hypothetical protein F-E9_191 [Faustovirus]
MNTMDTIIDLSAATDSIPVVNTDPNARLRVIIETDDRWKGVATGELPRARYEEHITNPIDKTIKLHLLGEINDDPNNMAELATAESTWIHNFVVECTRNLRDGVWTYPEEIQTSVHRSVYVILLFNGKRHYVRCKVGVYRALREAVVDYFTNNMIDNILSSQDREAVIRERVDDNDKLFDMLITNANYIHVRLCRDDEMITPTETLLFDVLMTQDSSNQDLRAINADAIPIIESFSNYLTMYTSFSMSYTTQTVNNNDNEPSLHNTPISSDDESNNGCDNSDCDYSDCDNSDCEGASERENSDSEDSFDAIEQIGTHGGATVPTIEAVVRHRRGAYSLVHSRHNDGAEATPTQSSDDNNVATNACTGDTILIVCTMIIVLVILLSVVEHILNA